MATDEESSNQNSISFQAGLSLFIPFCLGIIFLLVIPRVAAAATVYVDGNLAADCTSGNYSISGRNCSGADGNAYRTVYDGELTMVNGDTLSIRQGTYIIDQSIEVAFDGAATTTIQAYNSEAVTLHRPQVSGQIINLRTDNTKNILIKDLRFTSNRYEVISGWSNVSGNVWSASSSYMTTQLNFNSTKGSSVGSQGEVNSEHEYYYNSSTDTVYVYATSDPDTLYTSPGINMADDFSGIAIGSPSRNAVGNLVTIDNCEFENFSHCAIKGSWRWHVKNSTFNNVGTDTLDHHIYSGADQLAGQESIFEYNYFGYATGAGLHLYNTPEHHIARYNVMNGLSSSGERGYFGIIVQGPYNQIYNNTVYGYNRGIYIRHNTANYNVVKNNLATNNNTDLVIDIGGGGTFPIGNIVENNYYGSANKCSNCSDKTSTGGPDYTSFGTAPPQVPVTPPTGGETRPLFTGTLPYSQTSDFQIDPSDPDYAILTSSNVGAFAPGGITVTPATPPPPTPAAPPPAPPAPPPPVNPDPPAGSNNPDEVNPDAEGEPEGELLEDEDDQDETEWESSNDYSYYFSEDLESVSPIGQEETLGNDSAQKDDGDEGLILAAGISLTALVSGGAVGWYIRRRR